MPHWGDLIPAPQGVIRLVGNRSLTPLPTGNDYVVVSATDQHVIVNEPVFLEKRKKHSRALFTEDQRRHYDIYHGIDFCRFQFTRFFLYKCTQLRLFWKSVLFQADKNSIETREFTMTELAPFLDQGVKGARLIPFHVKCIDRFSR